LLIQSPYGKNLCKKIITEAFEKNEIKIVIGKIEGAFPFSYRLSSLKLQLANTQEIEVKDISTSISFLALIHKEIGIDALTIDTIRIIPPFQMTEEKEFEKEIIALPFSIFIKSCSIKKLEIPVNDTFISFSIDGKARVEKHSKEFNINAKVARNGFSKSYVDIKMRGLEKSKMITSRIKINIDDSKVFTPLFDFHGYSLQATLTSRGSWESFFDLFTTPPTSLAPPIFSRIQGQITLPKKNYTSLENTLSPILFSSTFTSTYDFAADFQQIYLQNNVMKASGKAKVDSFFQLNNASFTAQTTDIETINEEITLPFKKNILINADIKKEAKIPHINLAIKSDTVKLNNLTISDFLSKIEGNYQNKTLIGKSEIEGYALGNDFSSKQDFQLKTDFLSLSSIHFYSPTLSINGDLDITKWHFLSGKVFGSSTTGYELNTFIPYLEIEGNYNFEAIFNHDEEKQFLKLASVFFDFHRHDIIGEKAEILYETEDLYHPLLNGKLDCFAENLSYQNIKAENSFLTLESNQDHWEYQIGSEGEYETTYSFSSSGAIQLSDTMNTLNCDSLALTIYYHDLLLAKPFSLNWNSESFSITETTLVTEKGLLSTNLNYSKNGINGSLSLKNFPMDIFSVSPFDLNIKGNANLSLDIKTENKKVSSAFDFSSPKLSFINSTSPNPPTTSLTIKGKIDENILDSDAKISFNNQPLCEIQAKIPFKINFEPFSLTLDENKPFLSHLSFDGKAEYLLEYIDIGTQRIQGDLFCDLTLQNSLKKPSVSGTLSLHNGLYENYYTGSLLNQLSIDIVGKDQELAIQKIHGLDRKNGVFDASGKILLKYSEHFPYHLNVLFDDFISFDTDLAYATSNGKVSIKGNLYEGAINGTISITKADLTIPDKLPINVVEVPIIFLNDTTKIHKKDQNKRKKIYPLKLNLNIETAGDVRLGGRGLESYWKGNLHIKGTATQIDPDGELSLIRGNFAFGGRTFPLTFGEVIFPPGGNHIPALNIVAETSIEGTNISIQVKGPANSPDLFFQSAPPMTLSSILSLLLFGQDASEISGLQAIELASAVASVSGHGSNILESTRKSLGIDRLAIISTPATEVEDDDQMAVQVGKYISNGVLVTISQGMEQNSTNIGVEVDLSHGFIFQAETLQQQEQTRFTIKWNRSY